MNQSFCKTDEEVVFEEMKETFNFSQKADSNFVSCKRCGKRLMVRGYVGKPINERMIEHAEIFHKNYQV